MDAIVCAAPYLALTVFKQGRDSFRVNTLALRGDDREHRKRTRASLVYIGDMTIRRSFGIESDEPGICGYPVFAFTCLKQIRDVPVRQALIGSVACECV